MNLILGYGEIGRAIHSLDESSDYIDLSHCTACKDRQYDICHVCIPFCEDFCDIVKKYLINYKVNHCIIHSTVEVGTSKKIQQELSIPVNYSFVRGVHPNLTEGLKTFDKYIYGTDYESLLYCFIHLKKMGIPSVLFHDDCANGELAKLLDTTYYGYNIIFAKQTKKLCDEYNLDFHKVYTLPNETYNKGYSDLGMSNVIRPVLYPPSSKIGGHCVGQNFHLLPDCELKKWSIDNS